jgi:hypothetical protein
MSHQRARTHDLLAVGPRGEEIACRLVLEPVEHERRTGFSLTATMAGRPAITANGNDAFSTLQELRRELERDGVLIRCAGARRDVWASGMQRDMGGGLFAYVLGLPRPADRPPSVDIFEPTSAVQAATVAEQEAFFRKWCEAPGAA